MIITYENRAIEVDNDQFAELGQLGVITNSGIWLASADQFFAIGEQLGIIPCYIMDESEDGEIILFHPEGYMH